MREVKCQYCGRIYEINGDRDCCPACGSFNEFKQESNFKNSPQKKEFVKPVNNTNENHTVSKVKHVVLGMVLAPLLIFGILFMVILVDVINDEDDNDKSSDKYTKIEINVDNNGSNSNLSGGQEIVLADGTTTYYYFGDSLDWNDIDYDKYYEYKASYDECIELAKTMSDYQFSELETTISLNGKITANGTTIYIDSIYLNVSDFEYDSFLRISMESLGGGTTPDEFEMYLTNNNNRHRIKRDDYEISYVEGVEDPEDIFTTKFSNATYWKLANFNGEKYDNLEVVVDGEIFKFPLTYDNNNSKIKFYGTK